MPSTGYDIRPTKATFGECRNTIMPHKSKSRGLPALILRVSALLACAVAGGAVDVEVFQATEGPVQNVVVLNYSNAQDPIIVGGRNALYVLSSANFSLEAMESTGPENDSVACPPYPLDCDHSREETDNDNRVLLQMASNPIVLACGTTSQGMCAVHQPLRQLRVNKPMDKRLHVNYVASKESTVAFFGTGEYQAILFVGSTYDRRPLPYHPFAVSSRVLTKADTFALHEHTDSTASFVNVYKDFKTSYLIRYVYGFSYNGFAYFVTVQNKGAALDLFETRLVRVCEGDVSFLTYMEVPIECPKDAGMRFTIATSASFGPPSNWAGSGLGSGSKMLAVAFGSPVDGRRDKNDPNLGSVVCFFDMATVEKAFRETVVNCNEGKDRAKLSRLFHGSHADLKCTAIDLRGDALCSPGPNSYIEGVLPLFGRATIRLQERLATSVTLMEQNKTTVIWVGDHKGFLYKYFLRGDSPKLLFSKDLSNGEGVPIEKSTAVDRNGTYGYFLMGDRVIRFPVGSCSIYDGCPQCMRRSDEDPLKCGWCGDQCSHFAECKDGRLFEMERCPIYLESVSPSKGPTTGGTLLTFKGDNFGTPEHKPSSNIEITVGNHSCDLVHWNFTVVQCKTPVGQYGSKVDIVISVNDSHWDEVKKYDIVDKRTIDGGFEYEVATFTGVEPSYGPIAGGTNITLHGANFNIGSRQVVTIGDSVCDIFRVNRTFLECSTIAVAVDNVDQELPVTLAIDNVEVPFISADNLDSKFTYKQNPVIENIYPDTATFR